MRDSTLIEPGRQSRSLTHQSTSHAQYGIPHSEEAPRFVASRKPTDFNPLRFCSPPRQTAQERQTLIARAAYFRAEKRRFRAGHDLEDWLAAETEVDQQFADARWRNDGPVW
jgi:hypothetical protein